MIQKNYLQHLKCHDGLILREVFYVEQYQMLWLNPMVADQKISSFPPYHNKLRLHSKEHELLIVLI